MNPFFWAAPGLRRRTFLRVAGGTAASAALVLAGCGPDPSTPAPATGYRFAAGDTGQLNYFYLLQQLLVAFYTQGQAANPSGLQAGELDILSDLRDHHIVHLQTLNYALNATPGIAQLTYTFTSFTLSTRAGLLAAALTLEDLALAAFNFSLPLLSSLDNLTLAAKMASAQARHAATVRDLLDPTALAAPDAVLTPSSGSLARVAAPAVVLSTLAPYVAPLVFDGSLLPIA